MADQTPVTPAPVALVTPEVKDGKLTTEYLMTKVVVIGGTILGVLAGATQVLGFLNGFVPGNRYVSLAVGAVALITAAVKAMTYEATRTALKKNAQDNAQTVPVPASPAAANTVLSQ